MFVILFRFYLCCHYFQLLRQLHVFSMHFCRLTRLTRLFVFLFFFFVSACAWNMRFLSRHYTHTLTHVHHISALQIFTIPFQSNVSSSSSTIVATWKLQWFRYQLLSCLTFLLPFSITYYTYDFFLIFIARFYLLSCFFSRFYCLAAHIFWYASVVFLCFQFLLSEFFLRFLFLLALLPHLYLSIRLVCIEVYFTSGSFKYYTKITSCILMYIHHASSSSLYFVPFFAGHFPFLQFLW